MEDSKLWEGAIGTGSKLDSSHFRERHCVVTRLYLRIFARPSSKKPRHECHHMDLLEIASDTTGQTRALLSYRKGGYQQAQADFDAGVAYASAKRRSFALGGDNTWVAVRAIRGALRELYCGSPESSYLSVLIQRQPEAVPEPYGLGPAQGVARAYAARCSHAGRSCSATQLVELFLTAVTASGSPVCDLTQCPGLDPSSNINLDVECAILALSHDTRWSGLRVSGALCDTAARALGVVLRTNTTLTSARLEGVHGEQDLTALAVSLANVACTVRGLSLSGCRASIASFTRLCKTLAGGQRPLVSFAVARCKLSPRSSEALFGALASGCPGLQQLDFAGNKLDAAASAALSAWLTKAKALRSLSVADCAADVASICTAISGGASVATIETLDLSGNEVTLQCAAVVRDLCARVKRLQVLKLANTGYPVEPLERLLLSINANKDIAGLSLSLAKNSFGIAGAASFARGALTLRGVSHIDLSSTKLGSRGIADLLAGFKGAPDTLQSLCLGHNILDGKESHELVTKLITFLDQTPSLTALGISGIDKHGRGGSLGNAVLPLMTYISRNTTLRWLDVSGHGVGDIGAATLALSLRSNSTLTSLVIDRNKITTSGWLALGLAMEVNRTLQYMENPVEDVTWYRSAIAKSGALLEKQRFALEGLSLSLRRNNMQHKTPNIVPGGEMFPDILFAAAAAAKEEKPFFRAPSASSLAPPAASASTTPSAKSPLAAPMRVDPVPALMLHSPGESKRPLVLSDSSSSDEETDAGASPRRRPTLTRTKSASVRAFLSVDEEEECADMEKHLMEMLSGNATISGSRPSTALPGNRCPSPRDYQAPPRRPTRGESLANMPHS
eukprot:m51a1_g11891 hypothetical protein (849) ;mRNA; f:594421-597242